MCAADDAEIAALWKAVRSRVPEPAVALDFFFIVVVVAASIERVAEWQIGRLACERIQVCARY